MMMQLLAVDVSMSGAWATTDISSEVGADFEIHIKCNELLSADRDA